MSARTKARKRALDILFQADVRGDEPAAILAAEAKRAASEPSREASWLYAREIVDGVIDNRDAIDEQITTFAKDWSLARMPAVDRALLRIARVGGPLQRRGARRRRHRRGGRAREGVLDRRVGIVRQRRPRAHRPRLLTRAVADAGVPDRLRSWVV